MSTIRYRWRRGAHVPAGLKADLVAAEITAIEQQHGGLTPDLVVENARNEASAMHRWFEWDDDEAAHQYRIQQARQILSSVTVVYVDGPRQSEPVQAFVSLRIEDEPRRYHSITAAMANPQTRDIVLDDARRALAAWRRKYEGFAELADLYKAIDQQIA